MVRLRSSGYVRKPERLLDSSIKSIIKGKLEIKLISGQNLGHLLDPENRNSFVYVEIEVYDLEPGVKNPEEKSPAVQFNTFHPYWQNTPSYQFNVNNIDCSILFLRAIEAKEGLVLGRTAIPLECIRNGLRVFDLLDAEHDPILYARILCEIKLTQEANLFNF